MPAGLYHVTFRTAGPIAMFLDTDDRLDFLRRAASVGKRFGWAFRAFCLMRTHYHFLLEVGENRLQPGMHRLNGQYAQQFNQKYGRSGHLRGDRYTPTPVETERHLMASFRYIVRNPVRAGLCASPADWQWSSYRGTAGLDGRFAFVEDGPIRAAFGGDTEKALQRLRDFCEVS